MFDYIERFYNPRRRHSTRRYLGPNDFETRWISLTSCPRTGSRPGWASECRRIQGPDRIRWREKPYTKVSNARVLSIMVHSSEVWETGDEQLGTRKSKMTPRFALSKLLPIILRLWGVDTAMPLTSAMALWTI